MLAAARVATSPACRRSLWRGSRGSRRPPKGTRGPRGGSAACALSPRSALRSVSRTFASFAWITPHVQDIAVVPLVYCKKSFPSKFLKIASTTFF